ncbi:uncharacterized protein F4822DRAFT_397032 [Hypoxylon trugodes]|uniref:uncharacterized protein n=1 Tax=Hypoxylon trugodes TaxID=326681 RepID=UPI0021901AA7|nr:uncharacterized protein F4822DRAFT_397032 [Hypoxylon trugodes]KAI1391537.1 hypothetical protein F4822DRAFT_397032 [Hypoxylon trugodes]
MIFALRLAGILGCAITACATEASSSSEPHAGRNEINSNAEDGGIGNWGPADISIGVAGIDPEGWTPKPTAPPGAKPYDLELRRRQRTTATPTTTIATTAITTSASTDTCGYPLDNLSEPVVSCTGSNYCYANARYGAAGCCSSANRRDCIVPTTCIESQPTATNARTLACTDATAPRCMTYLYAANFGEFLDGFSFLACGTSAGSSSIAPPQSSATTTSDSSTTSSDATSSDTSTATSASPSSTSSTPPIVAASTSSGNRTGAIVGGVIGGVAGLALIAAAIILCLRYRKRKAAQANEVEKSPVYPDRDFGVASVYPGGLPEPVYTSDFYGELPPSMLQSHYSVAGYPPPQTNYEPVAIPPDIQRQRQSRYTNTTNMFSPVSPKPNDDDNIVSPISPGDQLNPADDPASYTWISNPTPPPQSEYSQFSPPPPAHFNSYRPYPGT